jgi:leucyl aminopeptidase
VAENMPSGRAVRPGDVVTHYNGTTVEVVNTDAEGRLVLADALARAAEDAPDLIVDAATLTGSSTIALGRHTYAVFGTDQARGDVIRAAAAAGESAWELPLQDELRADLKSTTADLCNYSAQGGGAITAALFLREFVPDGIEWSHLDVAGPAWNEGAAAFHNPEGATGVPVRTLLRLLEARAR